MNSGWALSFLFSGLTAATPLQLAAMGETVAESAGVLNIGIEGEILAGAFAAFAGARALASPAAGLFLAGLAGALLALLFSWIALLRGADQIVAGTAINLLALGITGVLAPTSSGSAAPVLRPLVGPLSALDLAALLLPAAFFLLLGRTSLGLRWRSCGQSIADSQALKIPVRKLRLGAVTLAGCLAGLAGACLTLELSDTFVEGISSGRGFIVIALVAFGRWNPLAVSGACLLFGILQALQFDLQARGFAALPPQAFLLLPYVLSLLALAGLAGKTRAPADLGRGASGG
jgi:simple sugar transport system permease protein